MGCNKKEIVTRVYFVGVAVYRGLFDETLRYLTKPIPRQKLLKAKALIGYSVSTLLCVCT